MQNETKEQRRAKKFRVLLKKINKTAELLFKTRKERGYRNLRDIHATSEGAN